MKAQAKRRERFKPLEPYQIIDGWLDRLNDTTEREMLIALCERYQRTPGRVVSYLAEKGLAASLAQVKSWMVKYGISPGIQAQRFNSDVQDYYGADIKGALERMAVKLGSIANLYMETVERVVEARMQQDDGAGIDPNTLSAMVAQMPTVASQTRQSLELVYKLQQKEEKADLILAGARWFITCLLESVPLTDKGWVEELCNATVQRLMEEMEMGD